LAQPIDGVDRFAIVESSNELTSGVIVVGSEAPTSSCAQGLIDVLAHAVHLPLAESIPSKYLPGVDLQSILHRMRWLIANSLKAFSDRTRVAPPPQNSLMW
jgi:hypothetical protein